MASPSDEATTTTVMWIFTILLFMGIIMIVYPVLSSVIHGKDVTHGIWAVGDKKTVTLYKTTAVFGSLFMLIGLLGATFTGISTEKGKETFVRMYMM